METEPNLREALRVQMTEFGRTPRQLFQRRHPRRRTDHNGCGFGRRPAQFPRVDGALPPIVQV
jgi:hypothetical protein